MKRAVWLLICVALFAFAGCNGGDDAVTGGSNAVGGAGSKGPFKTGAKVTACSVENGVTSTTTCVSGTVSDDKGTYALSGISWGGLTEVVITGAYLDETDITKTPSGTMSAIINLPAIGGELNSLTANPNVASTVAAKIAKTALATVSDTRTPAEKLSKANVDVASLLLGISDASIDLSKLNVIDTGVGAANSELNNALLLFSAKLQDAVNASGGNGVAASVDSIVNTLVDETVAIQNNTAATTSGALSAVENSVVTTATIAKNMETVTGVDATASLDTAVAVAPNLTRLRGIVLSGNQFTVGTDTSTITYIVDSNGNATTTGTPIAKNSVIFNLPFKAYNNPDGNATIAATYTNVALDFSLESTGDSRKVSGTLDKITIVTDTNGVASVTVPADAVLTYNGVDSNETTVNGTAKNIAANSNLVTFQNNNVSVDAIKLLAIIQGKLNVTQLDTLGTAGTFKFEIGIRGMSVGFENTAGDGILSLMPSIKTISGTLVIVN